MTLSLEQISARMRQGEDIPLSDTARIALTLSIPSILEQLVVTAMEYIDAAMVGHIGAEATAAIGIVSSSTWLLHGILVGLYTAFSIQMAHSETGIDIHPGAEIGGYFTIDHGTGVVIGETCIIGNNVKLYQGVTLGAKSFPLDEDGKPIKGIPRHPILEDNVIVYSNATILGRITIGQGATVGGNIWVTEDVPAGARIVQTKAKK